MSGRGICTAHYGALLTGDCVHTVADVPCADGWFLTTPAEQRYFCDGASGARCASDLGGCGGFVGIADAPVFYLGNRGWLHPSCYVARVLGWTSTPAPCPDVQAGETCPACAPSSDVTEDTENEPETCGTCSEPLDDCTCRECTHRRCGDMVPADEWCETCERCERHCDCWTCRGCDTRYTSDGDTFRCDTCEYCSDGCCDCFYCEGCNENCRPDSACGSCGDARCRECCSGHGDIPFCERFPSFRHAKTAKERQVNRSSRLLGAEIEVSSIDHDADTDALWRYCDRNGVSVVEDGSLPEGGFELNTVPSAGDHFVEHITALCRNLSRAGAEVNGRCGLHLHIDARDFSFYDMRRLVFLYQKLEPALFAMMPASRRKSHFCEPCGDKYAEAIEHGRLPKESKAALLAGIYEGTGANYKGRSMRDRRASKWGDARYRALNLHSWIYRGTIECRLHTGSVNANKIAAWGMLWASILDRAYTSKEDDIRALQTLTLADSIKLLLSIAPNKQTKDYICERIETFGAREGADYVRNLRLAI